MCRLKLEKFDRPVRTPCRFFCLNFRVRHEFLFCCARARNLDAQRYVCSLFVLFPRLSMLMPISPKTYVPCQFTVLKDKCISASGSYHVYFMALQPMSHAGELVGAASHSSFVIHIRNSDPSASTTLRTRASRPTAHPILPRHWRNSIASLKGKISCLAFFVPDLFVSSFSPEPRSPQAISY